MNKIYKVVWSKVKHCYVVTSELAKSQTKGCGARSLRMATVSLGVAASLLCSGAVLPIFGESVAEAAVTVSDASDPVNNVTPAGAIGYYDYGSTLLGFNVYTIQTAATTDKELSITGSSNNSVSAKNGFVGSFDLLNNVTGSGASLSNGTVGVLIGGGTYSGSNVTNNTVKVTGGTVDIGMYGGFSYSGKATGNSIEISGDSTVINSNPVGSNDDYSKVVGGSGKTGASKNTVTIKGGKINSYVYGGYSEDGVAGGNTAAEGNKVIMTGGKVNNYKNIYGGYSKNSNANFNAVTISGGEISYGCVYGGDGEGNVTNNSVTVSGGSTYDVVGGSGGGNVDNNTVTITGGTVMYVTGGNSGNGTADNNTVDISGGTIGSSDEGGSVVGASHAGGGANPTANNNRINIYNNANITGSISGAVDTYGYALASGNTITIDGSAVVTGNVAGVSGWGKKKQENKVFIKNGSVTGDVYGGLLENEYASEGSLIENEVNISGGTVTGNVYGGAVKGKVIGDVKENKVNIAGGTLAGGLYYGGYGSSSEISGNQIIIESGTFNNNGTLYGGYNFSSTGTTGAVKDNKVTINGVSTASDLYIYGGYTYSQGDYQAGEVTGNTVEISNGKIKGVYGGYVSVGKAQYSAKADDNTVSISGDAEVASGIYGGFSVTIATNNHVNLSGQSKVGGAVYGGYTSTPYTDYESGATGNDVTISENAELSNNVTGGFSQIGKAESNVITIKGGTVKEDSSSLDLFTSLIGNGVYGGFSRGSGNVLKNTVTIEGGTVNAYRGVYGGWAKNGTAGGSSADDGNKVSITSGTVSKFVYGGYSDSGNAKFNTVTVSSEAAVFGVVGGYSNTGAVTGNTVSISGGTVSNDVYGGSANSGTAGGDTADDGNKVTISSGTVEGTVYGGFSNTGAAKSNTVSISGGTGTISKVVYGGYSEKGAATGNTVSIEGGTVNGNVWGGFSKSGDPTKNSVTISGGTFNGQGIVGGYLQNKTGYNGSANENTVTISGGTFGGNVLFVQGGYTLNADNTTNNNTINLIGTVTGLENVSFYGGGSNASNTGNELHVGGIKGGANGVWQGKSGSTVNNKVKYVSRFDKVVLHSVKWDKDVAALEATTVNNVKTLDIKDLKFDKTPANGESMALLKSDSILGAGGVNIGLAYKDGSTEKTATSADLVTGVTFDSGTLADTAVNGVTLTGTQSKKVSLEDGEKTIMYSFSSSVDGITIATDTFTVNGVARSFGSGVNLTGATYTNNLAFSTASKKNMASGTSMVILDATEAVAVSGATLPAFTAQTYQENFDDPITGKVLTLSGTHTDTLALNTAQTQLIYTVGDQNVNKAAFNGEVTWDNSQVYYTADTKYKFGATDVDAENLKVTGTTTNVLKTGDAMTLLSASGLSAGTVTPQSAANKTASKITVNYSDTASGIAIGAEATGQVKAATNAVNYEVTSVTLNSVDLTNWNGTTAVVSEATAGWTVKNGASITTGDLADAGLDTMDPGDVKPILTADTTADFSVANISGNKAWQDGGTITDTDTSGVTVAGTTTGGGVKVDDTNKNVLVYQKDAKTITGITLGSVAFTKDGKVRSFDNSYNLTGADFTTTGFGISNASTATMNAGDTMVVVDAVNAIKGTGDATLQDFTTTNAGDAIAFTDQIEGKALILSGTHQDTLEQNADKTQIVYKVGDKNVTAAIFTGEVAWNDSEAYYTNDATKHKFNGATDIDATALKVTGTSSTALKKGDAMTLISATGLKAGTVTQPKDSGSIAMNYSEKGITLAGNVAGEVKAADNAVKYEVTGVNVNKADIGSVTWQKGVTLVDRSDKANNFAGVTTIGTDKFAMTYAKPEDVAANDSMTLLKANESLKAIISEEKAKVEKAYSVTPVDGVTVNAKLTSNVANTNGNVMVTVANNQASELKFEKVEWKTSGALLDHKTTLPKVSFDGATIDTSNIDFYKEMYIEADQQMTLVSDFGGTPKEIKGSKYMVGTAFDGEGSASMEGGNLIFRTKTSAGVSEQTHKAVMGVEATMGLLASGIGHLDKVLDGLGNASNAGTDGVSTSASIGGGKDRYETGSHVNINSWNAAVGVGAKKETKKGTLQYGIFGEYGKGSYTMHSDVGRSDGDAHYAGGGLMAKWTNKHDVYTEGGFRLGRVSDSANDLLRDGAGNAYGYDIHATYYGAHVGLGKVFNYKGGKSLDVYGKFFYTKRDGCEFDAKQHYNLDSVSSSVLRIGARYGTNDKKWNWYGGLAYEYEFDGEAKGTVNGTEIRAASIKGSSVRGEFGMRMDATKDNPWRTDISIYGYGGKHRGFGGSVNVAYTF